MADLASEIRSSRRPAGFPIRLVAIDGHGGAGKSTLATLLAPALGAEVIHTDDFASWDNPLDWWPRLVDEVLEPIRTGATTLSYACGSWSADHRPEPVVDQPVTDVMVLEGVSAARREFRPYLSFTVWVETPREVCLQRGLQRDGIEMHDHWQEWFEEEDAYVLRDQPRAYADRVLPGL